MLSKHLLSLRIGFLLSKVYWVSNDPLVVLKLHSKLITICNNGTSLAKRRGLNFRGYLLLGLDCLQFLLRQQGAHNGG